MPLQHNELRADGAANSREQPLAAAALCLRTESIPQAGDVAGVGRSRRGYSEAARCLFIARPVYLGEAVRVKMGWRGGVKPSGNQWRPESKEIEARLDGALLIFLMCLSSQANSEESKNPLIYYFIHTPHLLLIRPW